MPLPSNGTPWPPVAERDALAMMDEWSAWYSGEPDQLVEHYSRGHQVRPSQHAGGVRGRIARWWWGQPTPTGETRSKLHVPLAADIAGTSADLLFSEAPTIAADNASLQLAVDDLQEQGLAAQLHEAAEVAAALGGVYLRTVWDEDVAELPWLDAVHADAALPEWRWGRLHAVTFWRRLPELHSGQVHRLLERHEAGRILHGLYMGRDDNLGVAVPLESHPEAEHLAPIVDADSSVPTGTDRLTVSYVPNMRPNRKLRGSQLGRSDYQGVTPMLDSLDEAYSSWHRDIRLAKARLIVPESWIESAGPGQPGMADIDRELYQGVTKLDKGDGKAEAHQFAIRYAEHSQTCRDWTNTIVRSAGYSAQTFGETGDVAATATEVTARERRSYNTRGKKERYWLPALVEQLETLVDVANAQLSAGIREGDLSVTLGDGLQDSPAQLAQTAASLRAAEAASTETLVRMLHPDWNPAQVSAEVASIDGRNALPDPADAGL